ncbi:ribosome maturation factor RimP [Mongoliitalea daihaiensis]|uniref:ribosome maturation factor RimP n=1 Tax=Mongoliitalea daihaiensis TaxID=2782006 RepID=UPI001F38E4E6|nr:ribosome maturation factor RimP [Mongoliitalea daihaiensis]UJP66070.1 ribosome maturation factor RimP [Mongoliitalea daihaiensis]
MNVKQSIEEIVLKHLPDDTHFIVDVQVVEKSSKTAVKILIDADQGLNIDTCAIVSRAVGEEIEAKELLSDAYILEVSSPGLDFPLNSKRQYVKNVGRSLKITLQDDKEIQGELLSVDSYGLQLMVKQKEKGKKAVEEEKNLPFEQIKKSIVLVSFK